MPRSVILITCALCLIAGVLGFWLGRMSEPLNETHVITRIAQAHVDRFGGDLSQCLAVPGTGEIWIRVRCGVHVYDVDFRGQLLPESGPQT